MWGIKEVFIITPFEREIRQRLKEHSSEDKIYLKKNYLYEIFTRHTIRDDEVNYLFDMKKIITIYPNLAFSERIDAEINADKNRRIKIIFQFDPFVQGKKLTGKVGIITAFVI